MTLEVEQGYLNIKHTGISLNSGFSDQSTEPTSALDPTNQLATDNLVIMNEQPDSLMGGSMKLINALEVATTSLDPLPEGLVRINEPYNPVGGFKKLVKNKQVQNILLGTAVSLTPFPGDDYVYWSWGIFKVTRAMPVKVGIKWGFRLLNHD